MSNPDNLLGVPFGRLACAKCGTTKTPGKLVVFAGTVQMNKDNKVTGMTISFLCGPCEVLRSLCQLGKERSS